MTKQTAQTVIENCFRDILRECVANSYENRQNRSVVDMPELNLILSRGKERLCNQFEFFLSEYEELKHKQENEWRIPDEQE